MVHSSSIHPIRFMRTRPFAHKAIQFYEHLVGRGMPTYDSMQSVLNLITTHYNEIIEKLPIEKRPKRPIKMLSDEMSLSMHVGAFVEHGRNIFLLGRELVELLEHTDLQGIRASDVNLPFSVMHVSFGEVFGGTLPGPPNVIDGAYINKIDNLSLQILITSRRLDTRPDRASRWPFSRDLYFYAPLDANDLEKTFDELIEDSIEKGEVRVEPELLEADNDLSKVGEEFGVKIKDVRQQTRNEHAKFTREALPAFRKALALAVNALCYLSSKPLEEMAQHFPEDTPGKFVKALTAEKKSARKKAKSQLLNQGYMPVYLADTNISPNVVTPSTPSGKEVSTHWRRGHWRRQTFGSDHSQHRLMWIRPTLVRADKKDPVSGHLYHVK